MQTNVFDLFEKINKQLDALYKRIHLPKQEKLLRTLRSSAPSGLGLLGNGPPPETIEAFKDALLESPIFKKDKSGRITLRDPINNRAVPRSHAEQLCSLLASELYHYFRKEKTKTEALTSMSAILRAIGIIQEAQPVFILYGVKKEQYYQAIMKIEKIFLKACKNALTGISPYQRNELVGTLFPCYKKLSPELSETGIFQSIAYIVKHLGIENDDIGKISSKIERSFYRKNKPIDRELQEALETILPS